MPLPCIEKTTGPNPRHAVIWLHGLGADGHDFAPLVPELVRQGWPALRFVFPHAPVRAVTINNGVRMRAWYDIVGMDFPTRADSAGIVMGARCPIALTSRSDPIEARLASTALLGLVAAAREAAISA